MRKRKNAASVWIMVRRICQSGERDHKGDFLSVAGRCESVLVNNSAAVAVFEGTACNSSSWGGSCCCCCCCYSHHYHHHAGSVHVGSSPALGP